MNESMNQQLVLSCVSQLKMSNSNLHRYEHLLNYEGSRLRELNLVGENCSEDLT